jgi:hypothetical protein
MPLWGPVAASAGKVDFDTETDFDTFLFDTGINFVPAHCDVATRATVGTRAMETMSCMLEPGAHLSSHVWVLNKARACRDRAHPADTSLRACGSLAPADRLQLNYTSDFEYVVSDGAFCDIASDWVVTILPSGRFLLLAYYDTVGHTAC